MSNAATATRRAPSDRWFDKPTGSPADRIPAFREALVAVAQAWQERFTGLAAADGEISFTRVDVCRVDDVPTRRGPSAVLALVQAPGWKTKIGISFDRIFVTTMVEALFGGSGEGLEDTATAPLSPVDLQIAEVVARHVADALTLGFAKCLPSSFQVDGLQSKFDAGFLGKPTASVVAGTLSLATLGSVVELDILVPLAAMMVFADELATQSDAERTYEDPRWTQRLETEISRAAMPLTACVDITPMELGVIATLAVGQLIELPKGVTANVRLQCGGGDLFRCDLGQSAGFYTLRVEEVVGSLLADAELSADSAVAPDPFAADPMMKGLDPFATAGPASALDL